MHQSSDCILINNAGRNDWSHRSVLAVSGSPLSEFALMRIRPDLISWFQRVGEHRETGPTFRQVAYGILPSVHGAQWEIARRNRNLGVYEDRYSRISSCVLQREFCLSVKFLIHFINIDRGDPGIFSKRDPRSLFSLHFGELTLRDLSGGICGVGSLFGSATLFPHLSPHLVTDIGVGTQAEKSEYFNAKRYAFAAFLALLSGLLFVGYGWRVIRFRLYGNAPGNVLLPCLSLGFGSFLWAMGIPIFLEFFRSAS